MAQAAAHKLSNKCETIDLRERAIKLLQCRALLKPKTTSHTISDGDHWPGLSHG